MLLAAVNLLRTKPQLAACGERPELGPGAAALLRRLVAGEVLLVAGAIAGAAVLTSLAPPPKALASAGAAAARVGPGPVSEVVERNGYRLEFRVRPNRAAVPNDFGVRITRDLRARESGVIEVAGDYGRISIDTSRRLIVLARCR